MKYFCFLASTAVLLTLALARLAQAQAPAVLPQAPDSLVALLRQPTLPDTTRVNVLARLAGIRRETDMAEGRRLGEQGLALARRIHYLGGELKCAIILVDIAVNARQYEQAEQLAQQALQLSENAPPRLLYLRVMALQDLADVSNATNNNFRRAGRYYRQALALTRQIRPAKPWVLNNLLIDIAAFYGNRFQAGEATDSLRRLATYYARLGLRGAQAQHDEANMGQALVSLGIIARLTGQLDSAAYFMQNAIRAYQHQANLNSASFAWVSLASIRNKQGRFAAAAEASRQATRLAVQVQDVRTQSGAYQELSNAYAGQGNYRQAYEAARSVSTLNDSLNALSNSESLNALQVQFDTERKENHIRELTQQQIQQQQRLWALAAVLLAVAAGAVVVAVLALRLRRSRTLLAAQHTELVQTRATQDRLYALVAHDLRSPVVAFSGLADLLTRYVRRQETDHLLTLGDRIRQAARQLSELLDNLLNWAISQRNELRPVPQPLSVADLLADTLALYQPTAEAADIALSAEAPAADVQVLADADMTRTILRNLTSNALKATPAGGRVCLRALPGPQGVALQVADTGRGLPAAVQAQMQQADPHLHVAADGSGAGLGLLLSRRFAQAQGGTLVLAASPTGTGTIATLTLPAVEVTAGMRIPA